MKASPFREVIILNDYYAGGIYCSDCSGLTIINNKITGNHNRIGGGISCNDSSLFIVSNVIQGNKAISHGGGIGFDGNYADGSSAIAVNNIIVGNEAVFGNGGGIYSYYSSAVISNNTIVDNVAYSYGGGVWYSTPAVLTNNIIARNDAFLGGGIYLRLYDPSLYPVASNDFWKNDPQDFSPYHDNFKSKNIFEDPLFVDPENGDYHLRSESPCIEAGNNDWVPAGIDFDFDGRPRIADADSDGEAIVDIGAYEFPVNTPPVADAGEDQTVEADDSCVARVELDGADSYDEDGDELSYTWEGPFGEVAGQGVEVELRAGTHDITLTVDDGKDPAWDTVRVTVEDVTPPVPDEDPLPIVTGECSAEILSAPTATDNCSGTVPGITSDPLLYTEQGTYTVTWTFTDDSGNTTSQTQTVIVQDTTAPVIDSLSASPDVLWPPNHKMVPVALDVAASDNCDPDPVCGITAVSSNEPEVGQGDGKKAPDWEITGPLTLKLRAERSGKGSGRVYTITVRSTDFAGNFTEQQVTVTVPHDQREEGPGPDAAGQKGKNAPKGKK